MTGDVMRKVNGIRIFFVLTVIFVIGCYQAVDFQNKAEREKSAKTEQLRQTVRETETELEMLPVGRMQDYKFVIVEEADYLTVYFADRKTVYEYTAIRYSDLEDSLRQKIRKGYCIENEEELFGFLENYST